MTGVEAPRVVETHSALIFLVGDRAYKVKKPVSLGFLDFSTVERRRAVCHEEVRLNRRLAPDVYLGVHDVVDTDGVPYEHLVVMRRMPAERALSALLDAGADVRDDLRQLARLLTAFHATARRSPAIAAAGSVESVRHNWDTGLAALGEFVGPVLDAATYDGLVRLSARYLDGRGPLFALRQAEGRIRDGHGDLLSADVYCMDDGPRVLDCIEFDPLLRYGDVLLDVAFLAMDLMDRGHPELAESFLAQYEEFSGQYQPTSLTGHYLAYRAQVRCKVTCLRWAQGDESARPAAQRLAALALSQLADSAVRLVLVGGPPGVGTSTVAGGLADRHGWALARSDVVRKQLAGLRPEDRAAAPLDAGLYAPGSTDRTYAELLAHARTALGLGESVVLDASWSDPARRAAARAVADETCSELVELVCAAPPEVVAERTARRAVEGTDASDADPRTAALLAERFAPWPEAHVLDTTRPPEAVLDTATELVRVRPRGPQSTRTEHV